MTLGDGLLVFCKTLEISPDEFLKPRLPDGGETEAG